MKPESLFIILFLLACSVVTWFAMGWIQNWSGRHFERLMLKEMAKRQRGDSPSDQPESKV